MAAELRLSKEQLLRIEQTLTRIRKGLSALDNRDFEPVHTYKPFLCHLETRNGR